MRPAALEAMTSASKSAVSIDALQAGASDVLSELTGAEAGLVTSGCFAALALGTAACVAKLEVNVMNRLPAYAMRRDLEVIICRHHRNSYDRAFEMCGCTLVEVGYLDTYLGVGVREVDRHEIEAAITPRTVAIAYVAIEGMGPSLRSVAEIGHAAGLPVIVDAANQVPPLANLKRFIAGGPTSWR
ncbi:MAG: DegT/DnrJ/EryC1/StrS family aminotransferase [Trueperaceae bacterium]